MPSPERPHQPVADVSVPNTGGETEEALRALKQWKLRAEGVIEVSGQILREWQTATDESLYYGAMESILGIYPHELSGSFEKWVSLIHPDDRSEYRTEIQRVLTQGGPFQIEYRARKQNGKYTLLQERGYFISPTHGSSPVLSSIISDVSELRDLESRLRQSQRVEAFSQLTGGVAHDFNNMLSVVIGYAQILLEEMEPGTENRGFLEEIEKAAFRASSLTNQLLAFSKPPAMRKSILQLNELLNEVVKMLKRLLGEQIDLKIAPGDSIWPVQADRSQIEQVLINLAVGAREFMSDGGSLSISTSNEVLNVAKSFGERTLPAGRYVQVTLLHSPEIPKGGAKSLEKNRSVSTAQNVINQNEGMIVVESAARGNIELKIYLPSAQDVPVTATTPTPAKASQAASILLVEDDTAMRQFAKTVLSRLGHRVAEAADGESALVFFEKDKTFAPDLLIADMVMPRMGGMELAETITKKHPSTSVLLISGYPEQQILAQRSEVPFAFLKKPFAIGELISKVGSLLER
jgi:two-component system cell cycle sensor histidine kinase/response regulator CckA